MRMLIALSGLFLATPFFVSSQSPSTKIPGITEPPELTGEPKRTVPTREPSDSERRIDKAAQTDWRDLGQVKAITADLTQAITLFPDYSDVYFLRATARCSIAKKHYQTLAKDLDN